MFDKTTKMLIALNVILVLFLMVMMGGSLILNYGIESGEIDYLDGRYCLIENGNFVIIRTECGPALTYDADITYLNRFEAIVHTIL